MRVRLWAALLVAAICSVTQSALALAISGHEVMPFTTVGYIEQFILDIIDKSNQLATGAKIKVNGIEVLIPKNTVIMLPVALLTPYEIFVSQNPNRTQATALQPQSGLAIQDSPPPPRHFEAQIEGNIVDGQYIAGLVMISQEFANLGEGVITKIDLDTGDIYVGTTLAGVSAASNTVRLKLNDAVGRYGRPIPKQDPRFTADTDNPSIRATTGYPMCVPRFKTKDDPNCPAVNRPLDTFTKKPLTKFAMRTINAPLPTTVAGALAIPACTACNRFAQAPFMIGDYVAFSGNFARDEQGPYISVWGLIASVGIFTEPGLDPAYIAQDATFIATLGPNIPGIPQVPLEIADRIKVEGFTTDPSRPVEIYAVDFDKGRQTDVARYVTSVLRQAVPFGRFRLQVQDPTLPTLHDVSGNIVGASRQFMVRISGSVTPVSILKNTKKPLPNPPPQTLSDGDPVPDPSNHPELVVANGLIYGQYLAPIPLYIFPENRIPGDPLIPKNFECLNFLVKGSSPPSLNQLSPWPGATPPTSVFCGP